MKKGYFAAAVFLMLTTAPGFAGCSNSVDPPEYSYTNPEPIAAERYAPELAEGIAIDGEKEAAYGNPVHRLYHNNDPQQERYLDSYLYYGAQGLYCFVEVTDNCVYFEESRALYYNSSVELFFQSAETLSISKTTCQYRISCMGTFSKLSGVKSIGGYYSGYFDGLCAAKVNGMLNTNTCEGFDIECFIPWYELGVETPAEAEILFNIAYNRVTNADSGNRTRRRTALSNAFQGTPGTWVRTARAESGSAVGLESDGAFFGLLDGTYRTNWVFDTSQDNGTASAKTVITKAISHATAFAKDSPLSESQTAYFELTMKNIGGTVSSSPKAGLMAYFASNRVTLYTKGPGTEGADVRCGIVQRDDSNGSWNWDDAVYTDTAGENYTQEIKLAVYRNGKNLYFFVDDALYYTTDAERAAQAVYNEPLVIHDFTEYDTCYFGIYSASATAEFENYFILKDDAADAKFAQLLA